MIEPVQSGQVLLNDIASTRPRPGEVAIWWLGQSGYAIRTTSAIFYVDLYLSEYLTVKYANTEKPHIRITRAPIRGSELTEVDWLFATHKHSDHLDPETVPQIFNVSPRARLVLPAAAVEHAVSLGLDRKRLVPTRGDETIQIGPLKVHSIPSAHPNLDYTEQDGYPFLGYIFQVDDLTLYHSGDTLVYPGLAERLKRFSADGHGIDIAFLPINGTSARLEALKIAGNMGAQEAVALAREVGIGLVIPYHYDMFTFNTADVRDFEAVATNAVQPYAVLRCGERFCWRRQDKP
jgi:L-ascorbate 6-phosphate lactonase